MAEEKNIPFVHMTTINKKPTLRDGSCADWIATEKVHGSSFQFFTNDGINVCLGSRRNPLNRNGSFLKCGLSEFHARHFDFVHRMFHIIETEERWEQYRQVTGKEQGVDDDDDDDDGVEEEGAAADDDVGADNIDGAEESDKVENKCNNEEVNGQSAAEITGKDGLQSEMSDTKHIDLRIYGELYGGGGIDKDIKSAVQKEIIYSDEFRFYVFGITINQKWTTITEMNDLCKKAGFPYYAIPVCEPKAALDDLIEWLTSSGFMSSRSRLTERKDNFKTNIEGVVMCPLTRKDYKLHPIKLLSSEFDDVRNKGGKNKNQKPNYCTKARYHAVISKLDLHEREDADMVAEMFIADILKESGETVPSNNKRKSWTKSVRVWLAKDGYIPAEDGVKARDNKQAERTPTEKSDACTGGAAAATGCDMATEQTAEDDESAVDDIGGLFNL